MNQLNTNMAAVKVFISYSHKDIRFKEELVIRLKPLKAQKLIEPWTDNEILPGSLFKKEIVDAIENADVIILLVSPDFLSSDFIMNIELVKALTCIKSGHSCIIPVIIRQCGWEETFGEFKVLPTDGKAINTWNNEDVAFHDVIMGLKKVFKEQQIIRVKWKMENVIPEYDDALGKATSNIFPAATSIFQTKGIVRRFEKGSIYKITEKGDPRINRININDKHQAIINNSNIGICYEMRGGTNSDLGFPLSDLESKKESKYGIGFFQQFEGGSIYFKEKYGARALLDGNIRERFIYFEKWLKENIGNNWIGGILGFPITNEEKVLSKFKSEGLVQRFEDGFIIDWKAGTFAVYRGIYNLYQSVNYWNSELGFPLSEEDNLISGVSGIKGTIQYFENGCMVYNDNKKRCSLIYGEIYMIWKSKIKKYGFPVNIQYVVEYYSVQDFEGGSIRI